MPFRRLPDVDVCCGCVSDLKIASAIIAVLGIVTSPSVSWAIVRHAYAVRVSCFVTTAAGRPDIVDVNLNNVLTFGFGPNAGIGPTCFLRNSTRPPSVSFEHSDLKAGTGVTTAAKVLGWLVMIADLVFLLSCINFFYRIFKGGDRKAAKIFMFATAIVMVLSFLYGILYLSICVSVGGALPLYEIIFTFVDLIVWLYFLIVVKSYRNGGSTSLNQNDSTRNNIKITEGYRK